MAAIKKFFEKRKMDAKFKMAGGGHKLTEETRAHGSTSRAGPAPPVQRQASSGAAQTAAQAALARSQGKAGAAGPTFGTSSAAIKSQVRQEMEAQKKRQTEAQRLAEIYSAPREVELEGAPMLAVSGVYFKSPVTDDVTLPKAEMTAHIREFLYTQLGEEPQMTSALIIYTLNPDPDKVKVCVETLCKYLDNIILHPGEEKYCKIRVQNKAFQDRVCCLEGAEMFLQAAGFTPASLPGPSDGPPEDYLVLSPDKHTDVESLKSLKEILVNAEPIRPTLDHNVKVYVAPHNTNSGAVNRMEVPPEFYNIAPEEIKREQQAKNEAVERLGMLRTKEMRERERQRELRRYRYALIRVRFPDGVILQGTFRAGDRFSAVGDFVREHLELDWVPFTLSGQAGVRYEEGLMLSECGLAPAAVLHFAFDAGVLAEISAERGGVGNYLKVETLAQAQSL